MPFDPPSLKSGTARQAAGGNPRPFHRGIDLVLGQAWMPVVLTLVLGGQAIVLVSFVPLLRSGGDRGFNEWTSFACQVGIFACVAGAWLKARRLARSRHCSFCGREQPAVRRIIAGPGVHICDSCVGVCQKILERDPGTRP